MSLTNAETAMNALALAERARFQVERVRAAGGRAIRSAAAPPKRAERRSSSWWSRSLVATRSPLDRIRRRGLAGRPGRLLAEPGRGFTRSVLRGSEVVWTPADPNDSMTETDVMTTYPELRSVSMPVPFPPAEAMQPAPRRLLLDLALFGLSEIVLLIIGYYLWELITPYNLRREIQRTRIRQSPSWWLPSLSVWGSLLPPLSSSSSDVRPAEV